MPFFRKYLLLMVSLFVVGCIAKTSEAPHVNETIEIGGPDSWGTADPDVNISRDESNRLGVEASAFERALRDNALQFGSQTAFRQRWQEIEDKLSTRSGELSVIYDFGRVIALSPQGVGYILPPIVAKAEDAFSIDGDGQTVAAADTYLEILRGARLAASPPTWRDYLLFLDQDENVSQPSRLEPVHSGAKRHRQNHWIEMGRKAGVAQADDELAQRFRRLRRDFEGMLEYRRLELLGMVEPPEIFAAEFGTTGDIGQMRLGDRVVKIVKEADFLRPSSANSRLKR